MLVGWVVRLTTEASLSLSLSRLLCLGSALQVWAAMDWLTIRTGSFHFLTELTIYTHTTWQSRYTEEVWKAFGPQSASNYHASARCKRANVHACVCVFVCLCVCVFVCVSSAIRLTVHRPMHRPARSLGPVVNWELGKLWMHAPPAPVHNWEGIVRVLVSLPTQSFFALRI